MSETHVPMRPLQTFLPRALSSATSEAQFSSAMAELGLEYADIYANPEAASSEAQPDPPVQSRAQMARTFLAARHSRRVQPVDSRGSIIPKAAAERFAKRRDTSLCLKYENWAALNDTKSVVAPRAQSKPFAEYLGQEANAIIQATLQPLDASTRNHGTAFAFNVFNAKGVHGDRVRVPNRSVMGVFVTAMERFTLHQMGGILHTLREGDCLPNLTMTTVIEPTSRCLAYIRFTHTGEADPATKIMQQYSQDMWPAGDLRGGLQESELYENPSEEDD